MPAGWENPLPWWRLRYEIGNSRCKEKLAHQFPHLSDDAETETFVLGNTYLNVRRTLLHVDSDKVIARIFERYLCSVSSDVNHAQKYILELSNFIGNFLNGYFFKFNLFQL